MKFFILILSIIICSCSTLSLKLPETQNLNEIKNAVPGLKNLKYKLFKVEKSESGIAMVINNRNFLVDMFKQSKEPYFGTDRWSSECIQRNRIDLLRDTSALIDFEAYLTASNELKTGNCSPQSIDVIYLVGYCKEDKVFYEVTGVVEKNSKLEIRCPDILKIRH